MERYDAGEGFRQGDEPEEETLEQGMGSAHRDEAGPGDREASADETATAGAEREPAPDLAADLRQLGENLRDALSAAWESREREQLQAEIEEGLRGLRQSLGQTFDEAAEELRSRERVRQRVADMRAKAAGVREELRPGHVGDRVRLQLHDVLTRMNEQLERSQRRWTPRSGGPDVEA